MKNRKTAFWITKTGIFIALLVVVQYFTQSMQQLVTGSAVNLILAAAVLLSGYSSGVAVAALSPVFAFFLGIPAFLQLVPFIMVANIFWVSAWYWIAGRKSIGSGQRYLWFVAALIVGAVGKVALLYFGVVKLAVPYLLPAIEPKKAQMLCTMFSLPQLLTAGIGGALTVILVPAVQKALQKSRTARG